MTDLVVQLTKLSGIGAGFIWLGLLVFMRVGAAASLIPAFGEQSVPQRVRLVVALAFTAVVAAALQHTPDPAQASVFPLIAETVVGLMLGAGLRLFIVVLQIAGAMVAQATTLSQMFGDAGPEPQPAVGNLLIMAGLATAVTADLHVRIAELLIVSYQLLPLGELPTAANMAEWGVSQVAHAFSLAFSLAMPFTIAALLYNIALGVINRAMPSLMVSFIGAPALTAGGLILMMLVVPLALPIWSNALQHYLQAPFRVAP